MRERESFLGRLKQVRAELERVRRSIGAVAQEDRERVRASLDALREDYDVPPPHFAVRPEETEAFQRYLATAYRLAPILSNLDDPRWEAAYEEYERAWGELQRTSEPESDAAGP
jgi:hypothetical protein